MVAIPDSLTWELTRRNTAFLKKKNGHSKRSGAIQFSVEKGNIKSLNQFKFSGLANSKVCDVAFGDDNKAVLVTRTASKCHSKPSKSFATTPLNKDFRRVENTITTQTANNYYRRDLKQAALGKWTCVYKANRRAKGIKPVVAVKKGRGKLSS
ncbi:60S ribosomal protein L28 [Seminavis robusta]|uniref:60S ribosomal protein L28 n=1 Tax=Seminavis robusta TaxID=568900 RepID=A0A9N8E971_9STRA|nr:60S ribosomal protein L28 [Seminavis robusta]|eukprot:Sro827_g207890.1 60S ribosomal protein L28 (153) ;mRNA; r:36090-36548